MLTIKWNNISLIYMFHYCLLCSLLLNMWCGWKCLPIWVNFCAWFSFAWGNVLKLLPCYIPLAYDFGTLCFLFCNFHVFRNIRISSTETVSHYTIFCPVTNTMECQYHMHQNLHTGFPCINFDNVYMLNMPVELKRYCWREWLQYIS